VQKGVHEKVQGGYGKYQGTWVPLHEGRVLAERNKVLDKLAPILDYIPGDRSPPPAPKHATASSNRPKVPRAAPVPTRRNNGNDNVYSLEGIQCRRGLFFVPGRSMHVPETGADVKQPSSPTRSLRSVTTTTKNRLHCSRTHICTGTVPPTT
jgi:hypothetical protein